VVQCNTPYILDFSQKAIHLISINEGVMFYLHVMHDRFLDYIWHGIIALDLNGIVTAGRRTQILYTETWHNDSTILTTKC
jgi:hypothetical protein